MESGLNFSPPQPLSFDGNVSNNWRVWKQELTLYLDATESSDKSDKVKASIFLTCIGKKGREIYNTFTFDSDGDNMKLDKIIQKFDSYCAPRKNLTFLRYTFLTYRQHDGESFDEFTTTLRKLSQDCEFGDLKDSLIKDMITIGTNDKALQEREPEINLDKCIKIGQAAEITRKHAKIIQAHSEEKSTSAITKTDPDTYSVNTLTEDEWLIAIETNGSIIPYKIDTGAQVNILSKADFQQVKQKSKLHKSAVKLSAYNGSAIPVVGKSVLTLNHKGRCYPVLFIIVDIEATPILGLTTCSHLNLINRIMHVDKNMHEIMTQQFPDCFDEIGKLLGVQHITIDPTVPPVVHPPRKLPIALKEKLHTELKRMVKMGIIKPVHEPTDWVNSLVVVEKPNGKLRICLDPKDLNKAIKRHHFHLPTTEEILASMSNAKFFTKLDASNAYWQIEVDEESSRLLTFNTPFGRFSFQRLPFGIHSASEICQAKISEILEGIEGALNSQDDIIIWGSDKAELAARTTKVLDSIRSSGLKLNKEKCKFEAQTTTFLGHKISAHGVEADPAKITAILSMPEPTSKKELQRFLGMITYLGKFIPNLSDLTAPLRSLLEKDAIYSFDKPQKDAINELKEVITSNQILKFLTPHCQSGYKQMHRAKALVQSLSSSIPKAGIQLHMPAAPSHNLRETTVSLKRKL
eukprot:Seg874.6 transcript_id=Seg874.6/GoldUCD/mRNA.D3Y31 product="putative protein K02A2.6" protein_id=Seg874.6/GoldUCD/D3Y31